MTFIGGLIDAGKMFSIFELEILGTKDLVDMTFINLITLWMTLKTAKNREDM